MRQGGKRNKIGAAALILVLSLFLAWPAAAATVPEYQAEYGYAADFADVLTAATINHINETNEALSAASGAEVFVVTVDFTGGADIETYAYRLFNQWAIGGEEKDNGLLLLLVIGEENYWAVQGEGLEKDFSSGLLSEYLDTYLETDFAAGNYDAGVAKFFDACVARLEKIYGGAGGAAGVGGNAGGEPRPSSPARSGRRV
ncbi:MAG: TPM domain-containing protein, partial [Peptococcaceae bacterium]|nr:TPM domain-containing protein [Peptococcaceae bacterium]